MLNEDLKIILVDPPLDRITVSKYEPAFSIGLQSIKSYLKPHGFTNVKLCNYFKLNWQGIKESLRKDSPDVIGISCCSDSRLFSFRLVSLIKEINPECCIILGNIHASFFPEEIIKNFPVDICVIGEGEQTMLECLEAIKNGGDLSNIRGIAFRKGDQVVSAEARPLAQDLDMIDFSKDKRIYTGINGEPSANILTSRGCPFDCTFCSSGAFWGRTWRKRSPEKVVEELGYLVAQGAKEIVFLDDLFTLDQKRAIQICELIIDRKLQFKWSARARVDCISEELIENMKKAGCWEISCGVESGSPKILKLINKKIDLDNAVEAFDLIKRNNIVARANFMVGSQGETLETIEETVKFVKRLNIDDITMSRATIYPNTHLYKCALENGIISKDFWIKDFSLAPYYTVDFTADELRAHSVRILLSWLMAKGPLFLIYYTYKNLKQSGIKTGSLYVYNWIINFIRSLFKGCKRK